jgi:hypothetical protein
MLTIILVCAMCARQSVSAISLRQKNPFDLEGVLSDPLLIPPLAASLKSELSEMPTSKMATEAIDPAAVDLEGYIMIQTGGDSSCNSWEIAEPFSLNLCYKRSDEEYTRYTATSTAQATQSTYTDSKCEITLISAVTLSLGGCDLGKRYVYSSTRVPQSTRPFAKAT